VIEASTSREYQWKDQLIWTIAHLLPKEPAKRVLRVGYGLDFSPLLSSNTIDDSIEEIQVCF